MPAQRPLASESLRPMPETGFANDFERCKVTTPLLNIASPWRMSGQERLFLGLLRRYDLKPYRYHGQRYTTVMVRVPKSFVDETLWPEFQELNQTLRAYLDEVTDRVIQAEIYGDSSEAEVRAEPLGLEVGTRPREIP